ISYEWAPPYRYQVIKGRLEEKKKFTLEDFRSIQHEETSLPGRALARVIGAADLRDPELDPYAKLLAGGGGGLWEGAAAGGLSAVWVQEVEGGLLRRDVAEKVLESVRALSRLDVMINAVEKADPAWFGQSARQERDRLVRTTFARAVRRAKVLLGPDPAQWRW